MTSTTLYKPGNVVMVRIKFTANDRTKRRPAVILTNDNYHNSRADAIVVALSSRLDNPYYGDYELSDWQAAGLPQPSKAKGIIQTIDRTTIEQTFGTLSDNDYNNLKDCIRTMLCLDF
jgi:mRNA interferase MazF